MWELIREHLYIRQVIDKSNIIGDLKTDYEELFLEILKKVEEFDNEVIESALR